MVPEIADGYDHAPERLHPLATAATDALAALQRAALDECGGKAGTGLPADAGIEWRTGMSAAELTEQVWEAARLAVSNSCAVQHNRVYCYNCESAGCEHAAAPAPGCVFAGYGNTGRPQWQELFSFMLILDDERVDALFDDRPLLLARVVGRRRLIDQQFAAFGRGSLTYRIIGQVVAGYLLVGGQRCALTAQIVETRDHRLHVQVITPDVAKEALTDASAQRAAALHRVFDALQDACKRVTALSHSWRTCSEKGGRRKMQEQLFGVLRHLAHSLERKGRQGRRRTSHAELRSQQQRPVHKAREDVLEAPTDRFFRDGFTNYVIVLGRGERLHVFAEDGKHVTSLILAGDKLASRTRRRRYRPLPAAEVTHFRAVIAGVGGRSAAVGG